MTKKLTNHIPLPGGRRYPWAVWFKRKKFVLAKGVDFQIQTHGMANMIRGRAKILGFRVSLEVQADVITVTTEKLK